MRRIIPIVLALVVLLPTVAQAAAWYRCVHDGAVRSRCCCPVKKAQHDSDPAPGLRKSCCCEITNATEATQAPRDNPPVAIHAPAPPAVIVLAMSDVADPRPLRLARSTSIVPTGPPEPAFVRNCALLL